MSERNDCINLDNLKSFWGKWFWAAYAKRCDRIMLSWSNTQHSFLAQQWTQGSLGKSIAVSQHQFDVLQSAAMWIVEEKVCYARLRCNGSDHTLIGVLNCSRRKISGGTGCSLNAIRFSDLAELWHWMGQMRAVRQTADLETNTAPALGQQTRPGARL